MDKVLISRLGKWREPLALVCLCGLIALCYGQTLGHDFFWDSNHIFKHDAMRELSPESIWWILTNTVNANWHPVSLLTHIIDFRLFGWDAGGHHFVNVVLHCLVTITVFYLVKQLLNVVSRDSDRQTSIFMVAAITSLLFALHPLRVESVAWVAARKDLLYSLFYLLSIVSYVKYTQRGTNAYQYYALSLLLFGVSLLSKSMAVTLPAVLILLDYYPLTRLQRNQLKPALLDKIPYVLMSLVIIAVTLLTQTHAMADERLPPLDQLSNSIHNVVFYLDKFIVPTGLVPFYPFPPDEQFHSLMYWFPALVLIVVFTGIAVFLARRGQPVWFVCWGLYLVMLAPASGLIQVGSAVAADRYTYLTLLPICFLTALGYVYFWYTYHALRRVTLIVLALLTLTLTGITTIQVRHWESPITLWSHVLRFYPDAALAHRNISVAYRVIGNYDEAINHLQYIAYQGWPVGDELAESILVGGNPLQAINQFLIVLDTENLNPQQRKVLEGVVESLREALKQKAEAAPTILES